MSVRSELTTRLAAFAAAYTNNAVQPYVTKLPVAYEGVPFVKPANTEPFLEMFIVPAHIKDVTVDGTRRREVGIMQVNVWSKAGVGTAQGEAIAYALRAAFPLLPKQGSVSVENTPSIKPAILDVAGYRVIPVIINYRQEIVA